MKRTERLQCSVTPEEQKAFKKLAIEEGYSNGAGLLRELVYDKLEEEGIETSREANQGNVNSPVRAS